MEIKHLLVIYISIIGLILLAGTIGIVFADKVFSMTVYVIKDDGYKEIQLVIVENESDLPKLDRIACGLSFQGCALMNKIYMIGNNGETLWHELNHHIGN